MRLQRALNSYPPTFLVAALLTLLALGTSEPAAAADCYLMLYLGADEHQVTAAGKTMNELEKGELPILDAGAPTYFVLLKDMTMAVVEQAGREEGISEDAASSSGGSAVAIASESAADASGSAAQDESQSGSTDMKIREFIPHEEIGLGYFCPDGSDEGESWSAPGGRIYAFTKGNDLIIGLTKKGSPPPV